MKSVLALTMVASVAAFAPAGTSSRQGVALSETKVRHDTARHGIAIGHCIIVLARAAPCCDVAALVF